MPKTKSENLSESESVCEFCGGIGYILVEGKGAQPCKCQSDAKYQENMRNARIPKKFSNKFLDNFKTPTKKADEIVQFIQAWIDSYSPGGKGLFLVGDVGSGKTHIAVAILKELIARGFTGLYYNVVDLLKDIRATMSKDYQVSEYQILDETCNVDVLVLDDIGAEKTSDWVLDRIYHIINKRYESQVTTIVTSNFNYDENEARVGKRIASRLKEMCIMVHFPFDDYRRQLVEQTVILSKKKK